MKSIIFHAIKPLMVLCFIASISACASTQTKPESPGGTGTPGTSSGAQTPAQANIVAVGEAGGAVVPRAIIDIISC
ncbi:hypothetical protein [Legionella waltersii]|uniref:Lipoprotein n=1 Tax=Legionella waltersii TaxID=66969 RepID=A0A0W1A525_9GAMM|nr:hypothetical protein [Legionella waltersii]KTD76436.1 hypothetical protein Lwal_2158 [Legionella waltersii]SNV14439.1 Uncharacterised protein [Legionella waltersii]